MKKQIVVGILVIAVFVVWGLVIYRVFKDAELPDSSLQDNVPVKSVVNKIRDSLKLDYSDPFLDEVISNEEKSADGDSSCLDQERPEPPLTPTLIYKGIISDGYEHHAMVLQNGELLVLKANDFIGDFRIVSFTPEIITLQNGGNKIDVSVR